MVWLSQGFSPKTPFTAVCYPQEMGEVCQGAQWTHHEGVLKERC